MLKPRRIDVEAEQLVQQHGDEAEPAERGEEREGQRHAGKIRGDAGKGERRRAYPVGQPAAHDGDRDGQAGEGADQRRGDADLDRNPVGRDDRRLRQRGDVLEREFAGIVLKRAQHQIERRQDQEHHGEDEERRDAQPLRRQPHAARLGRRGAPGDGRIGEADVCHAPATVFEKIRAARSPPG